MNDHERLSRYLDGDLSDDERTALETRLASEPELAERWAAMRDLAAQLDDLPMAPPPELDAAVLAASPTATPTKPSDADGWRLVPWLVAAAAVALVFLGSGPSHETQMQILEGSHRLEGHVHALAGTVPIEVDGIAVVTVEPRGGSVREWGRPEEPMPKTALLSALAGAAVTVAVYEGTARIADPGSEAPLTIAAGETRTVGGPAQARRVVRASDLPADATPAQQLEALEAENAALREELGRVQFEGAMVKGQLAAHQGEPIDWPASVPAGMEPDTYEAGLRKILDAHPDMELAAIDCGEYPCVAVITGPAGHDGWEKEFQAIPEAFVAEQFPDQPMGMQVMVAGADDGEEMKGALGLALLPETEGEGRDPAVETRMGYRARELLDGYVDGE